MARRGIELEVKFAPAGEATLAALAARAAFPGWRVAARHDEDQRNTYYDTAAGALEAADCSLRRRVLAEGVEWTFKRGRGPGRDGVSRRREVNRLLPPGATDLPKCEPVARARKVAGGEALAPLFTLRTRRRQLDLARDDGTRVALALDRVRLKGHPAYEEAEVEIELLDGDERALAQLGLWLMATYGLLPLRGSNRGRAQAWLRGEGLPVVGPALGLRLIAGRVAALAPGLHGRPAVVKLAAPRGSPQARLLAEALARLLPAARLVAGPPPHDPTAEPGAGPVIVEGPDVLEAEHADVGAWVKAGLPRPLLARLLADADAAGLDEWAILRRCGEYAVPSQRRFLDPAARWADLVVIANHPPAEADDHGTPPVQRKVYGWPSDEALARAGAVAGATDEEHDIYFRPPAARDDDLLRARLRADTAWVSFGRDGAGAPVATYEARPRVLDLLAGLGYRPTGEVRKTRRRYRLDGWEVALDHVAGLGYFCELRHDGGAPARDAAAILAALGLAGARATTATYLALTHEAGAADQASRSQSS
ncbi:MAG TPA: CYTH domain-containing protein [Thermomicrobiales bacterium]|nr:CYTH domain-containing protein [Thermomicrobiales bacterium]